jgi:hypothetical protein
MTPRTILLFSRDPGPDAAIWLLAFFVAPAAHERVVVRTINASTLLVWNEAADTRPVEDGVTYVPTTAPAPSEQSKLAATMIWGEHISCDRIS